MRVNFSTMSARDKGSLAPLYRALGYQPVEEIAYPASGLTIPFVRMAKSSLSPEGRAPAGDSGASSAPPDR